MAYENKTIAEATEQELLHALLSRLGTQAGPHKSTYHEPTRTATVPIGDDASASIVIFGQDMEALNEIVKQGG